MVMESCHTIYLSANTVGVVVTLFGSNSKHIYTEINTYDHQLKSKHNLRSVFSSLFILFNFIVPIARKMHVDSVSNRTVGIFHRNLKLALEF